MTTCLPALPALVAARALQDDAAAAARRALSQVERLLGFYDTALALVGELPPAAREALARALHRRLVSTEGAARAAQARLDEAAAFCGSFRDTASPLAMVAVPSPFYEMLSPYLDDAMAPVLESISRRAGASAEEVGRLFPQPVLAV